jgi:hypothetical protein
MYKILGMMSIAMMTAPIITSVPGIMCSIMLI